MKHLNEQQLVLHYYQEHEVDETTAEEHLAACEACRREYQSLQRVLNSLDSLPVPERSPEYEASVWRRLEPRLGARSRWSLTAQRWLAAGAMAVLIAAAFLAGRGSRLPAPAPAGRTNQGGPIRARVLLIAVGDHLERSHMVLAELTNAEPRMTPSDRLDISFEQRTAEDLLETNRLYRQTAASAGDASTAAVLEDLERVLMEIAHSPSSVSARQLDDLKRQIEDRGILFEVKVFGAQLRQQEAKEQL